MKKELNSWFSPALQKEMPIVTYGDYGTAILFMALPCYSYPLLRQITWSMNDFR